jgi:hypothetical protein
MVNRSSPRGRRLIPPLLDFPKSILSSIPLDVCPEFLAYSTLPLIIRYILLYLRRFCSDPQGCYKYLITKSKCILEDRTLAPPFDSKHYILIVFLD